MKAYTDLEQSKKLAEILPIESADMYYYTVNGDWEWFETPNFIQRRDDLDEHAMPAWSLAALQDILPNGTETHKQVNESISCYFVEVYNNKKYFSTERYDDLLDACVEMIFILKEKDLLQC